MLPDIDSLALFIRAAEFGSVTRAAEASHITVPAASRRLAMLEQQLDARLYERHSRGIELTPAGEHLLVLARDLVARMRRLRAEMSNYAAGSRTVLRVQGNTSAMAQFLPGDIAGFQTSHPDVRIVLEECWSDEGLGRIRHGAADLGVVVGGGDASGLWSCRYRADRLGAVLRADDPLCANLPGAEADIDFSEVLARDLVGLEGSSRLTRLLTAQAELAGRPMALRAQVRSFEAVCRSVDAGLGIGVLPVAAARNYAGPMKLRVLPLADAWASREMALVMRGPPQPGSALAALAGHLQVCAQEDSSNG
ncbi:MAG: LysR family transcriptional regulator [Burkholderiaceae bacterium]